MEHLLEYFNNEVIFHKEKKSYDEEHKNKIRFIYTFAIIFAILLFCSFFNIH